MPTDVIMPQMGESIFEGTLTKWLKKPGDKVQRDEPLFEISTDKVDAEIPAPASGVLKEVKVQEGATVQVNTVVGVIADGDGAGGAAPSTPAKAAAPEPAKTAGAPSAASTNGPSRPTAAAPSAPEQDETETESAPAGSPQTSNVTEISHAEGERVRSSPLVRKIAKENNVDLARVPATGMGGRITKEDILSFIQKYPAGAAQPAAPAQRAAGAPSAPAAQGAAAPAPALPAPVPGEVVPMSKMRSIIAQRMVESKHTSAHVHSVYEVDMTHVMNLRAKLKNKFEQTTGSKLTPTTFFAKAAVKALREFPIVNASVEGDNINYHREINIGIAVALDWGLIVPVIKHAEEKSFLGLQRAISDLGDRARAKKLLPDDVQGGTFTITNPGQFGQMFGLPIILQPQVAIMGIGSIKKMPVVVTDASGSDSIAIRSICHISLGYDHRVIDGAVADQFLRAVAQHLEKWNEELF